MMYRGARAARKMLRFVHVCIYIDAGEPVRSAHGIHKLTESTYFALGQKVRKLSCHSMSGCNRWFDFTCIPYINSNSMMVHSTTPGGMLSSSRRDTLPTGAECVEVTLRLSILVLTG